MTTTPSEDTSWWFVKVVRSGARAEDGSLPAEVWKQGGVHPTMNGFDQGDARATVVVVPELAASLSVSEPERPDRAGAVTGRLGSRRAQTSEDDETWAEGPVAPTLNQFDGGDTRATVAVVSGPDVSGTTRTHPRPGSNSDGSIAFHVTQDPISGDVAPAMGQGSPRGCGTIGVLEAATVRRLTPLECERLQGFPDDWTEGQPDSTRYKQMGNAVAVPCVEWIIRRLVEEESRG